MNRLFDFRCQSCDTITERLVVTGVTAVMCSCGSKADRVVSAVRVTLDPISGHFPKATYRWAKQRQKQIGIERRNNANHGTHD